MKEHYKEIFIKHGFRFARLLGSKSLYRGSHPNNLIIFNARIYTKSIYIRHNEDIKDFFKGQEHEIWYGDLDLSKDLRELFLVHLDIHESIVITSEMGRKVIGIGE